MNFLNKINYISFMRNVFKPALLSVFTFLLLIGTCFANDQALIDDARNMLKSRDAEIKELIGPKGMEFTDEQMETLKDIINNVIDYAAMAEYALGDTWNTLSADQRKEFVDIFATIVRDQSLNSLDIYRADVAYDTFEVKEGKVIARTIATLDNVRTPVIYEMVKKNGKWMVEDMSVDNVSTAESYKRSFQNIIRRRGYDALLDNLKRRAGQV
jgi:phospholipid transport system substrate-binding protein